MRVFNTEGICNPEKHYMVDISDRLYQIKLMIDSGKYFTINRARQYGKSTTLSALRKYLADEYLVISLDFQGLSTSSFETEEKFVKAFSTMILNKRKTGLNISPAIEQRLSSIASQEDEYADLPGLFDVITDWCATSEKKIVLFIDEVDSATNNQVFLDFLSQLRDLYNSRESEGAATFQSVILAGVTDVKHLKSRIRDEDQHKVNSPWNIAADFDLDMSLSESGIQNMLSEYDSDHQTHMDVADVSKIIREYTSGYPFLVSRICLIMDQKLAPEKFDSLTDVWTKEGVVEAVKAILSEKNTLFDSLTGKLTNYPKIKKALRRILMEGAKIAYNPDQEEIVQLETYGFIKNLNNTVVISNRIFETRLYNLFLSEDELDDNDISKEAGLNRNIFVKDSQLDVKLILEHFIKTYNQIFGPLTEKFKEKDGRELFLMYLKPIINGTGNYYIEAQTRDQRRTDVIIDYLGHQYIIELKIWRGERYNNDGEQQICDYLDYFDLDIGYMLSFNFNKNKESGVKELTLRSKTIIEGTV